MRADLVCKGGGIRGIGLVGALCYLEEKNYEWYRVSGTSIGAIIASLIAVGYNSDELKNIILSLDFRIFNDKNKLSHLPFVGELSNFLYNKGLFSGNKAEEFLSDLYVAKGKTKFKDILINGESRLKVIACDVTRKKLLILPNDLKEYNIDPLDFPIAKAVRMSMSIPFYYNPVEIKYNNTTCYIVDGGLVSNFPIWIFDRGELPRLPTLGLNIYGENENSKNLNSSSLINYSLDVGKAALFTDESAFIHNKDKVRIVNIPTLGINPTDFNLSKPKKIALYNSGYNSAKRFLNNWDFNEYVRKYRC